MTTIVPDTTNEEGQKLANYQPGDVVEIEFNVVENADGQLGTEVTRCELVGGDGAEGYEEEEVVEEAVPVAPVTAAPRRKVPNAVVIAVGRGK